MKYIYIGKDGDMGYKQGETYYGTLETSRSVDGAVVFIPGIFPLNIFSRKMVIPYGSLNAFRANWLIK